MQLVSPERKPDHRCVHAVFEQRRRDARGEAGQGLADGGDDLLPGEAFEPVADVELDPAPPRLEPLAFSGIHVISPRFFPLMTEEGIFSIIDCYLRLAGSGEKIAAFRADEYYWRDFGDAGFDYAHSSAL